MTVNIDNVTLDYKLEAGILSVEFSKFQNEENYKIDLYAFDTARNMMGSHKLLAKNLTSHDICFRIIEAFLIVHFSYNYKIGDAHVAYDLTKRIINKWPFKVY